MRHHRPDAYSAEQVLLNKRQIYGGAPKVNCYPVQSLVSKISRAQICLALTSGIVRWNIVLLSYNLTVACHICVQSTVDYIGVTRTVGVVWVYRRFDLSPF